MSEKEYEREGFDKAELPISNDILEGRKLLLIEVRQN
jgi:hypothetical protein